MGIDTVLLRLALPVLVIAAAPGCDDATSSSSGEPGPASDEQAPAKPVEAQAKAAEGPAPTLLRFKDKSGRRGFACDPHTKDPIHCGVIVAFDTWHFAGPVGTRIKIDEQEYVLTQEHALDKKAKRSLSKRKLGKISSAEAHMELPFPGPTFVGGEFTGLCAKGKSGDREYAFQLEVRIPGVEAPLQTMEKVGYNAKAVDSVITESWYGVRDALARELAGAIDPDAGSKLPPLADGAQAAIFGGKCYGGDVSGLEDLRYVVRKVETSQDDSLRRKKKCGTYRSKSNYVKELSHTMSDTRAEIWDVRARKVVAKKVFRAKTPKCPRKITNTSSGEYSSADWKVINAWAKAELTRRAGPVIEPS